MSIQKVLEMAEMFVALAEEGKGTVVLQPARNEYQVQREKLSDFFDKFFNQLRRVIAEMSNDLSTLRERRFDAKLFRTFAKVYDNLITVHKEISEEKPYIAADKLVHYVMDRPTRIILENLNYLAKEHLKATNVDIKETKFLKHPQIRSLDELGQFVIKLKEYMDKNPLIVPPGISSPPEPRLMEVQKELPEFKAEQGDKTNPAVPVAMKK